MSDARARERELIAEAERREMEKLDETSSQMAPGAADVDDRSSQSKLEGHGEEPEMQLSKDSSPASSPSMKPKASKTPKSGSLEQPSSSRSTSGRKRNRALHPASHDSSGLPTNALALKTLTNSNTAKNQEYYSELQTQIVRKPGNRPLSPIGKTQLTAQKQKQKDDQDKQRAERAKRRRGENAYDDGFDISVESDDIGSLKHPRAPGDEEDFVTPERFTNGGKRVKWDKMLAAARILDDIKPRLHGGHREPEKSTKGCLIKSVVGIMFPSKTTSSFTSFRFAWTRLAT